MEATPAAAIRGGGQKAIVTYVSDGDTAKMSSGVNCRIDGIDAPETAKPKFNKAGQPYGEEAKKTLEQLIANKEVTVRITKPSDKYGRAICQIEISGKDVSHEMVKAGAAWVYEQYARDPSLKVEQLAAQKNRRGLWGVPGVPEYPPVFRQRQ